MTGGPFRVIEGGRGDEPSAGLLIHGAAEVVTMAGGLRVGSAQGDVERLVREDDPQRLSRQQQQLRDAGAIVLPSSTAAARFAGGIGKHAESGARRSTLEPAR